jgi:type IV secretion system protein TrbC
MTRSHRRRLAARRGRDAVLKRRRLSLAIASAVAGVLLAPSLAYAAGAGAAAAMPWTGPLQTLLDNLSGPTARIVAGLGFVIGGGIWAFSRSEEGAKRFGQIVIGAAIAIGAANIVTSLAFVGAVV